MPADLDVRRDREDAVAQLLLEAVHHRQHDDQRGDAERDARHRRQRDERDERVAAGAAARARVAQADDELVGRQGAVRWAARETRQASQSTTRRSAAAARRRPSRRGAAGAAGRDRAPRGRRTRCRARRRPRRCRSPASRPTSIARSPGILPRTDSSAAFTDGRRARALRDGSRSFQTTTCLSMGLSGERNRVAARVRTRGGHYRMPAFDLRTTSRPRYTDATSAAAAHRRSRCASLATVARATAGADATAPSHRDRPTGSEATRSRRRSMHLVLAAPASLRCARSDATRRAPRLPGFARLLATAGAPTRERRTGSPPRSPRTTASRARPTGRSRRFGLRRSASIPATRIGSPRIRSRSSRAATTRTSAPRSAISPRPRRHALIATLERALRRRRPHVRRAAARCVVRARPGAPALSTRPLAAAQGKSLRTQMPAGADAKTWWRWQEEIQMLLFAHPVTAARERAGRASANGVWLSTGGTLPGAAGAAAVDRDVRGRRPRRVRSRRTSAHGADRCPRISTQRSRRRSAARTIVVAFAAPVDFEAHRSRVCGPGRRSRSRAARSQRVTVIADGAAARCSWTAQRPRWTARIARPFRDNPTSWRCSPRAKREEA